jgi:hypothetical protein
VQFLRTSGFPMRSALSAGAAVSAVIGLVVGVQLASGHGQTPATVDRGGNPLPGGQQQGGDLPPMDGMPSTVIMSTVMVNGTPTVKTITVSRSAAPTSILTQQQQAQQAANDGGVHLTLTTPVLTSDPVAQTSSTHTTSESPGTSGPPSTSASSAVNHNP